MTVPAAVYRRWLSPFPTTTVQGWIGPTCWTEKGKPRPRIPSIAPSIERIRVLGLASGPLAPMDQKSKGVPSPSPSPASSPSGGRKDARRPRASDGELACAVAQSKPACSRGVTEGWQGSAESEADARSPRVQPEASQRPAFDALAVTRAPWRKRALVVTGQISGRKEFFKGGDHGCGRIVAAYALPLMSVTIINARQSRTSPSSLESSYDIVFDGSGTDLGAVRQRYASDRRAGAHR